MRREGAQLVRWGESSIVRVGERIKSGSREKARKWGGDKVSMTYCDVGQRRVHWMRKGDETVFCACLSSGPRGIVCK